MYKVLKERLDQQRVKITWYEANSKGKYLELGNKTVYAVLKHKSLAVYVKTKNLMFRLIQESEKTS